MTGKILAIDTATGPCSAAVWKDGKIAAYVENSKPIMQSASLMPMIEDALAQSGTGYRDLSAIACTIGPGSFTGIRVGLAAARAIAFAANIPTLGFTTLEVLAFGAKSKNETILTVLNAGKGEWYYQLYSLELKALAEAALGTPEEIAKLMAPPMLVAGNVELKTPPAITFPRADALAELAATHPARARELKPFYIRAPDAKLPATAS